MKDYIELRAIEVGRYIIDSKATVRKTATKFGVSKSTVHKDLTYTRGYGYPAEISAFTSGKLTDIFY